MRVIVIQNFNENISTIAHQISWDPVQENEKHPRRDFKTEKSYFRKQIVFFHWISRGKNFRGKWLTKVFQKPQLTLRISIK